MIFLSFLMKRIFLSLCSILAFHVQVWGATDSALEARYEDLRSTFEKGNFEQARKTGEKLVEDRHLSPELFQILGHTNYRLGDLGQAALWYRRASLIPPLSTEIRQNLAHLHERTGNLSFPANGLLDQISGKLSRTQWLLIAVMGGWVFLLTALLTVFFIRSTFLRSWLILIQVLSLMATISAILNWRWHPSYQRVHPLAVVIANDVMVYTSATVTGGSVTKLPPGSELRRLEDRGDWTYVEVCTEQQDLRRGWVKNSAFAPLWPYDAAYLEQGL